MNFFDKTKDAGKTKLDGKVQGAFLPIGTYLASKQYRVTKHLGEGGFGKTYLVENSFGKQYVIKEFYIADCCTRSGDFAVSVEPATKQPIFNDQGEKFRKEACRLNEFRHPNIVRVSALFEENNTYYYVMDYIDGMSLEQKIKKGKLSEQQILKYLEDILNALDYIHEKGVVHYDLKPGNIMLDKNDNAILIDFGSSKHFNTQSLNETYMSTTYPPFTPGFAPFEQIHGKKEEMGRHSDIYALGATLYKLYTRKNPPTLNEVASQGIPDIPNASPLMQSIIKKAMAFLAKDRIRNVAEFRALLSGNEQPCQSSVITVTQPAKNEVTVSRTEKNSLSIKEHLTPKRLIAAGAMLFTIISIFAISKMCSSSGVSTGGNEKQDTIQTILANGDTALITSQGDTIEIREKIIPFENFTETVNGVSFKMIAVEGGTFRMGSNDSVTFGYPVKPVHSVTLSDYYIGETEVTQGLWEAVMGTTIDQQRKKAEKAEEYWGSNCDLCGVGNNYPMYYVSWDDCQEFIKKLNELTGKEFRLPTEAEWEYAARGGNKSRGYKYSGSNTKDDVAWYNDNACDGVGKTSLNYGTHLVGTKAPNELRIYDMTGNVNEWCSDWYEAYSSSPQTNPTGPTSGSSRVLRGGSWDSYAPTILVICRHTITPAFLSYSLGFRLVMP